MAEEKALAKFDDVLEQHRKAGFNILLPTVTIKETSPYHQASLEVVRISTEPSDKEIYEPMKGSGDWAFTAVALRKVAYAAAITWRPDMSYRCDDGKNPDIVRFKATASIQKEDGKWREQSNEYELDLKEIEKELRRSYANKAERYSKENKKNPWSEAKKKDYIETNLERDMIQKRKFKVQLAETGAMNRVIRNLLALKSSYKIDQLEKPFVIPKITFHPDIEDPETRRILLTQGRQSIGELYGTSLPLNGQPPEPGNGGDRKGPAPDGKTIEMGPVEVDGRKEYIPEGEAEGDVITEEEAQKAAFVQQDDDGQIKMLEEMMKRKGYDGRKLKKPLEKFNEEQRTAFYDHLAGMEDHEEIPF